MAVPVRSDFLAYNDFPEVYHGDGISKAAISAAARRVTARIINTTYRRNAAKRVAYVVFWCRCAPAGLKQIRNYLFSDLRSGEEELLQHGHKKRVIVAMRGLLHRMQNSRLTETEMATIRKGKLFSGFFTDRP
ncbi:hypothetical protein SG74_23020 [Enterobacter hormaechei subsp. xiangfangensis]|nr:hypothetical protein SG74_23020 [Enterobacter hormaechei subsp. xiangfangensis]